MNRKFQQGDYAVINKKYKDRYNCLVGVGQVVEILPLSGRLRYKVQFFGKAPFTFYSYELDKVTEDQKWEIEYKLYEPDPYDMWKCPRCGSRNVHCYSGMYVARFECQDCHWDWR